MLGVTHATKTICSYSEEKDSLGSNAQEVSQAALSALRSLHTTLRSDAVSEQLSEEDVASILNAAHTYQETTTTHGRVSAFFLRLFRFEKKARIAQQIQNQGTQLLERNKRLTQQLFTETAADLEEKIKIDPEKGRDAARQEILRIAKGKRGVLRMPVESVIEGLATIGGQGLQQVLGEEELFTPTELRRGQLNPNATPTIGSQLEKLAESPTPLAPPAELGILSLRDERHFRLEHLSYIYRKMQRTPDQTVKSKYFPATTGWYVGACRASGAIPFERSMQRIGEENGIVVVSDCTDPTFSRSQNAVLFTHPLDAAYPQDFVDFSTEEVRVPLLQDQAYETRIEDAVREGRLARSDLWTMQSISLPSGEECTIIPPFTSIGWVNQVWEEKQSLKGIALGRAIGAPTLMNLTYSESGNTLLGQRGDGTPYMILGVDSFVVSKALMEEELGRKMNTDEVLLAFAIDYGIRVEEIHIVEQPGDFHLDMNAAIIGPNTIAVNDALQAALDYDSSVEADLRSKGITNPEQIEKTKKELMIKAVQKKLFEDKMAADLEERGFKVKRVAGSFYTKMPFAPATQVMNFFNSVTATTPQNRRIIVAMGVTDREYERRFLEAMSEDGRPPDQVYFLDHEESKASLVLHGGISCRTKTI